MPAITLPNGIINSPAKPFSHAAMLELLRQIAGSPFTGYLSVTTGDRHFLLFIFQGKPYAAGLTVDDKPSPLTITNFCSQIAAITQGSGSIILHETDPVLLKCMLVFIQEEPAAKGPVDLINLQGIVQQIHEQATDALVILERDGLCNFFFFLGGTKTAAYWSEYLQSGATPQTVDEQMLAYAYQKSTAPVNAMIYQSLKTMESLDSARMSIEGLMRLFGADSVAQVPPAEPAPPPRPHSGHLKLRVVEGPMAGTVLAADLPCILGRKDADLIIGDPMVSKRHAALQLINGHLLLVDLHSTNGTTLNNDPVTQREVKQGDRIGIGQTVLLIEAVNLP